MTNNLQPLIILVDQIFAAKNQHTPLSPLYRGEENADTSALERQIDQMVYKLYDITPKEIAIVENLNQK
jgi:hypothetical protein